jgi:hypothetical protein
VLHKFPRSTQQKLCRGEQVQNLHLQRSFYNEMPTMSE